MKYPIRKYAWTPCMYYSISQCVCTEKLFGATSELESFASLMGRNACSFLPQVSLHHLQNFATLSLWLRLGVERRPKKIFVHSPHKLPGLKSMLIPWIIHKFEFSKIWIKKNPCKVTHFTNDFSLFLTFVWSSSTSIHHLEQHLIDVRMTSNTKRASMLYIQHL